MFTTRTVRMQTIIVLAALAAMPVPTMGIALDINSAGHRLMRKYNSGHDDTINGTTAATTAINCNDAFKAAIFQCYCGPCYDYGPCTNVRHGYTSQSCTVAAPDINLCATKVNNACYAQVSNAAAVIACGQEMLNEVRDECQDFMQECG